MKIHVTGTLPSPEEVTFQWNQKEKRIRYKKSQRNTRTACVKVLG